MQNAMAPAWVVVSAAFTWFELQLISSGLLMRQRARESKPEWKIYEDLKFGGSFCRRWHSSPLAAAVGDEDRSCS
ncbi:uncharacterized protein G2W53_029765 [Senna tora]|uniref:Uncharacterized protein n=1 Tax=Senna tora TaxID=362788 RepID=A0A834WE08_9FABA|nr:uncharacterized protein G2W53_029765 [Senna tora]